MDFIANSEEQRAEMLRTIGVASVDDLFAAVPSELWRPPPAADDGLSESEGMRLFAAAAASNTYATYDSYLGAGAERHHTPAVVARLCSKGEFLTSYTPYQAEASQGMLQVIFEFQSTICALTGLDVANASLYDGAASCAEAATMALRLRPGRHEIVVAETLHPHYRAVVEQYLAATGATVITVPAGSDGGVDADALAARLSDRVAAVLLQSPNFWGIVEAGEPLFARAHAIGALAILCGSPLAMALFANAADQGADIAAGDCQPLGLPLNFGGPYVGYLACREAFVRQMPGRLVGRARDARGRDGFVLTLQAREQHIRREKATSNVCTNQALAAMAALVAAMWYGPHGLEALALTNYQRTAYLRQRLAALPGVTTLGGDRHFNEFVVDFGLPTDVVEAHFRSQDILAGIPLKRWYPHMANSLLVCVTELKERSHLDHYVAVAASLPRS